MNPLVLLTLIGGAHNDALMTGFLVVGLALAVQATSRLGPVLRLAARRRSKRRPRSVSPSSRGTGSGPTRSLRERLRPFAIGGVVAAAVLGVTTLARGVRLRLGEQSSLQRHGALVGRARDRRRAWRSPTSLHALGLHSHHARLGALGDAVPRSRDRGGASRSGCCGTPKSAAGCARSVCRCSSSSSLGPVVQPWYLAWGLVVLAASYKGREHFWLLAALDHRTVHRTARRTSAARRTRALESAAHRARRRDPRRRADLPDGPLDPVVVARGASSRSEPRDAMPGAGANGSPRHATGTRRRPASARACGRPRLRCPPG